MAMLKTFAKTLMLPHRDLLAWYYMPISTSSREGTNNKIKTLPRQAYGFRDQQYFTSHGESTASMRQSTH
jgi:transposase